MVDLTNESDKREVGVPALEQVYGKSVARAAKRQRNARLGMTSEGRKPGWGSYAILIVTLLIFVFPLYSRCITRCPSHRRIRQATSMV